VSLLNSFSRINPCRDSSFIATPSITFLEGQHSRIENMIQILNLISRGGNCRSFS